MRPVSLIIPTYNEKQNIEKLIPKVFKIFKNNRIDAELIVVDDNSPDGTAQAAESQSKKYNVRVLKRIGKRGLSSAVLDGFLMARGDILGVMDADFSHPMEKIPEMISTMNDYDFVIGSRLVKGGSIKNWPRKRVLISTVARLLARGLTRIKDNGSGFFFIKKGVLDTKDLNPMGYKICLELIVKGKYRKIKEIPITFKDRMHGESKLGNFVMFEYLIHLLKLYSYKFRRIFFIS